MELTSRKNATMSALRRGVAELSAAAMVGAVVVTSATIIAPVAEAANVTQSADGTLTYQFDKGSPQPINAGDYVAGGFFLQISNNDRPAGGVTINTTNGSMTFDIKCENGPPEVVVAPMANRSVFITTDDPYPSGDDKDPAVYKDNWLQLPNSVCGGGKITDYSATLKMRLTSNPPISRIAVNAAWAIAKKLSCQTTWDGKECTASSWSGKSDFFSVAQDYLCVAPTDVTTNSATMRGETSNMNVDNTTTFTLDKPGTVGAVTVVNGGIGKAVSAPATNLQPNTTYTYTISFKVANTTVGSAVCTFTTNPLAPQYLCLSALDITTNSATMRAETSNMNVDNTTTFTLDKPGTVGAVTVVNGGIGKIVSAPATNLQPNTTYQYTVTFKVANATVGSVVCTFTTNPLAPQYLCLSALDITTNSATMRAETSNMNVDNTTTFTLDKPGTVGAVTVVNGGIGKIVSAPATNLQPNTTYQYTVTFKVANATVGSVVCTFTTNPLAPQYLCLSALDITTNSATMRAETSNMNVDNTTTFTLDKPGTVGAVTVVNGGIGKIVSAPATNLQPNTTYQYTVTFKVANVTVGSVVCTFTTNPLAPQYLCLPATDVTAVAAIMRGETSNMNVDTTTTFTLDKPGTVGAVTVVNGGIGKIVSAPASGLQPGTTYTYTITFKVGGATVGSAVCTFTTAPPASIDITKYINDFDANTPADAVPVPVGSTMQIKFTVKNNGTVDLVNVTVTDNKIAAANIDCGGAAPNRNVRPGTVVAGSSFDCTATFTAPLTPDTLHANEATVVGTPVNNGPDVTDKDPAHAKTPPQIITGTPGILIIKRVNGFDANDAPGVTVAVGSTLNFTYEVYNTGTVPLSNVTVTDQVLVGGASTVKVTCPSTDLPVGTTPMICTGSGPAPASGQYTNVGTVVGTPPTGITPDRVTDDDPANAFVPTPGIGIIKRVNNADANEAPGITLIVGSPVSWTYEVTNTGNVDLINVTVTDDKGVTVDCGGSNVIALLKVKEQKICSGSGTAILGQYTNTGIVVGTPNPPLLPGQPPIPTPPVTAQDPANYIGTPVAVVLPPPAVIPEGELPQTGSNSGGLIAFAGGLLLLGGLLFGASRRRRMA